MHTLVQYLFESSSCLVLLYAFYYLVLRKETFFQLNRIYLLSSPFMALSIPLINIDLSFSTTSQQYPLIYPIVSNAQGVQEEFWNQMTEPTPAFQLTVADLLFFVYLLGALFMAIRLGIGLFRLFKLIQKSRRSRQASFTLVETDASIPAASFFSYVFWNQRSLSDEKRIILEHELVHVRQKHSFDVLLMEFCVILKWFNPLIYWFRNSLRETHEYIADSYMSKQIGSAYSYATFLATHSYLSESAHPLANNFAAIVRKRLKMLARGESSKWKYVKYMLSLPLLGSLLLLFSFNLVEQLPDPITQPFRNAEGFIEEMAEQPVISIASEILEEPSLLYWGDQQFPLASMNEFGEMSLDVAHVSPALFKQLINQPFVLTGQHYKIPFESVLVDVRLSEENGQQFNFAAHKTHLFTERIQPLGEVFTAYLRFKVNDKSYCSIINVTNDKTYVDNVFFFSEYIQNEGDGMSVTICCHVDSDIRQARAIPPSGPYLALKDYMIPLAEVDKSFDFEVPTSQIPAKVLEILMNSTPKVQLEDGKEREVKRIALSLLANGEEKNCDFEPNYRITCVQDLINAADTSGESLTILIRTERQSAFVGRVVWEEEQTNASWEEIGTPYLKERWPIFTQKASTVIPPNIPRPAFHQSSYMVEWGGIQIPIPKAANSNSYVGTITLSEQAFRTILLEDIAVYYRDLPMSVIGFNPVSANTLTLSDFFSFYRWMMQENGVYEVNESPLLESRHLDIILQKLDEGYETFYFSARLPEENEPTNSLSFQVKVKRSAEPQASSSPGIYIDPSINAFQLVNRPNQPTIIKIDTADQRYRWMYDMYKDKPEVQVYHIPDFKTINRVITLDDALLPASTLEQRKVLMRNPLNIDNLPEYYDFKEKSVVLQWGTLVGVDDQTVYNLKEFKQQSKQEIQLQVGEEKLVLQQFDLLFVAEKGDVLRFTTDRVNRKEIQEIIRKMGPKTSVLITKIVAKNSTDMLLHFPLTFAYHLN
ncbi:MAG: M56 family metallopeptidase [Bacteroidota bacterium]